jgi:two-component system chemotaxis response regulator CheB
MREELIAKLQAATHARRRAVSPIPGEIVRASATSTFGLLAIGASTGGPRAVSTVIASLPANVPVPVVVALHIPEGYTKPLAERIASTARLPVVEGQSGALLERGTVVIVPGGHQSEVIGSRDRLRLSVFKTTPASYPFAPSIDLLLESAARAASPVLAAILTGMGSDGTKGATEIRKRGGEVVTEAEESCVVYGMPRSVFDAGQSDRAVPLEKIAEHLVRRLAGA